MKMQDKDFNLNFKESWYFYVFVFEVLTKEKQ